jgi:hypothetical protein
VHCCVRQQRLARFGAELVYELAVCHNFDRCKPREPQRDTRCLLVFLSELDVLDLHFDLPAEWSIRYACLLSAWTSTAPSQNFSGQASKTTIQVQIAFKNFLTIVTPSKIRRCDPDSRD